MRRVRTLVAASVLSATALLAGCGGDSGSEASAETAPAAAASEQAEAAAKATTVKLQASDYGKVLFDGKGGVLYLFTADTGKQSKCYEECAVEWPPFYARGKFKPGPGVNAKLLGRTTRSDGRKQVTYAGHPLYYWYKDPPNEILCHNAFEFDGYWLVVKKSGKPA